MLAAFNIQNIYSYENNLNDPDLKQEEVVVIDSLSNLHVIDSTIFLVDEITKYSFKILKIESFDDKWAITISKDYLNSCCAKGHPLCSNCGQCHTKDCWYFVKFCNRWR